METHCTGRTYKLMNRFTYYIMRDYSLKPHVNGGLQGHDESATKIFRAANQALLRGRLPNFSDSLRGVFPIGKTIPAMHSIDVLQLPCNFSNVLPSNCASLCICKCHRNRPRLSAVAEPCGSAPGRRAVRLCTWSPSGAAVRVVAERCGCACSWSGAAGVGFGALLLTTAAS